MGPILARRGRRWNQRGMEFASNPGWRSRLAALLRRRDDARADRVERQLHAVADAQLLEDVVEVRLHRHLGDEEVPRDLGVAHAEGDVPDDLALACGEPLVHGRAQLRGELGLQRGGHPHVSLGDGTDRRHQRLDREALEHDRASAGAQRAERVFRALARGHDDDRDARREPLDVAERAPLHLEVEQEDVGGGLLEQRGQGPDAVDLGDDADALLQREHGAQPLAEERVIVGDRDPQGSGLARHASTSSTRSCAPEGRRRRSSSRPASSETRDAIDHGAGASAANPTPSSSIEMWTFPSTVRTLRLALRALAWRRTLRSPSSRICSTWSTNSAEPVNSAATETLGASRGCATAGPASTSIRDRMYARSSSYSRFTLLWRSVSSRNASSGRPRRISSREDSSRRFTPASACA